MAKKQPIRKRMKKVIESLREGKKTWSELVNLGIPEKTLDRILKEYLIPFELVKKEEDKYVWYEYSKKVSANDFQLALEHSRRLLPALENMLEVAGVERHPYYSYAKEHLKFYPDIYQKLLNFEAVFHERVRYLLGKHGNKILGPDRFTILEPVEDKGKGFFGKLLKTTKFKRQELPYLIVDHPEIKNLEQLEKTEDYRELMELRDFLDNNRLFNERFAEYEELAKAIYSLKLDIELGLRPLEGKCSKCPNVKIE